MLLEIENKQILLEIKSIMPPSKKHASGLEKVKKLIPSAKAFIVCNVSKTTPITKNIMALSWSEFIEKQLEEIYTND